MNKEQARNLLKFVNDPWVNEDLKTYAKIRIDDLRKVLEVEEDIDKIRLIQGSIKELKRLFTLQDQVREEAK